MIEEAESVRHRNQPAPRRGMAGRLFVALLLILVLGYVGYLAVALGPDVLSLTCRTS